MKKKVYSLFCYCFALLFAIVFIGTIINNKSLVCQTSPIYIFLSFMGLFIVLVGCYYLFQFKTKEISKKQEILIVISLFIIILLLQNYVAWSLKGTPCWDWENVMSSAKNFVLGNKAQVDFYYFQEFPNNSALFYLEIGLFYVLNFFHLMNYYLEATIIFNIILVDIGIIFLFLTVRKLFDKKAGIFSLILVLLTTPFFTYLPIFYTDTVTMLFPITMFYIYLCEIKDKNKTNKKTFFRYLIIAILAVIAFKLKFTCVIMLIAIIIDIIMTQKKEYILKAIVICLIPVFLLSEIYKIVEVKKSIFPFDIKNNEKRIPYTHWIMMGLEKNKSNIPTRDFIGTYSIYAYNYTRSFATTKERVVANKAKIKEVICDYGFLNYSKFLYEKMLYVWSEGTYYATASVNKPELMESKHLVPQLIYKGKMTSKLIFLENTGMILFMYMMFGFSAIYYISKKKSLVMAPMLAITGVLIFFLMWEASSRYLVNYVPIFLVVTMSGLIYLTSLIHEKIMLKRENKE